MRFTRGFTLIELLLVVTIVGILGSIALPSYVAHLDRARRSEARATLMEAAQFMQRYYATRDTYKNAVLPSRLTVSPPGSEAANAGYLLSATSDETSFTVSATPVRADDPCGALTLTHTGLRSRSGKDKTEAECWR